MSNGCILNGGTGSGKSRTGLYYYFKEQGGSMIPEHVTMKHPKDLYIITTAMKRDSLEWVGELANYGLTIGFNSYYNCNIFVDSWNNIKKYGDVKDSFFIFDEDKVTGKGVWANTFIKIARHNDWIVLSATPGDTFEDYVPVFIANGFFKNRSEFNAEHVVFSRYTKWPQIEKYINVQKLIELRERILISMDIIRTTVPHHYDIYVDYDKNKYKDVVKNRWDPYKDEPIEQVSSLCYILRRIVNEDESRVVALLEILEKTPRAIIFYNFDYELEILRYILCDDDCSRYNSLSDYEVAEWNGHAHQPIPDSDKWIYLVQYTAGCEGWNCISTNTIIFFSQNYSYKVMEQAAGRIDRLNTKFIDLYYYHLKSHSSIDLAISKALKTKKLFNEGKFVGSNYIK